MHLSWQELRTVTLAQALERADTERTLVSQIEWDEATRQARNSSPSLRVTSSNSFMA